MACKQQVSQIPSWRKSCFTAPLASLAVLIYPSGEPNLLLGIVINLGMWMLLIMFEITPLLCILTRISLHS